LLPREVAAAAASIRRRRSPCAAGGKTLRKGCCRPWYRSALSQVIAQLQPSFVVDSLPWAALGTRDLAWQEEDRFSHGSSFKAWRS